MPNVCTERDGSHSPSRSPSAVRPRSPRVRPAIPEPSPIDQPSAHSTSFRRVMGRSVARVRPGKPQTIESVQQRRTFATDRRSSDTFQQVLPDFGQDVCSLLPDASLSIAVTAVRPSFSFGDLRTHLEQSTALSPSEAERVIAEVLAYFDEDVPGFVRRRHTELQSRGLRNEQAFTRIAEELERRRFAAPALSLRQLRRIVYT